MQFKWKKQLLLLIHLLWATPLLANPFEHLPTVGEIANKLIVGTDFVTKLVLLVCFVVGATLVMTAIGQFRSHHYNPKMVPLDRPIVYLTLGMALFFLPFLGNIFVPTSSTIDLKKREEMQYYSIDVDTLLEFVEELDH